MTIARLRQCAAAIGERIYIQNKEHRKIVEWQTREISRMLAASIPYEGDGESPYMKYAIEEVYLETPAEKKARENSVRPEDMLQDGGYERFTRFMSAPVHEEGQQEGQQTLQILEGDGPPKLDPLY